MPIYDLEKKAEREFRAIRRSKILHERNRELLLKYERELKLNEIFAERIHKLLTHLKVMIEELSERTSDDTGREDLKEVIEEIYDRKLSEATISDYKQALKQFYKRLNGGSIRRK